MLENSGIKMDQYREVSNPEDLFANAHNGQFQLILVEVDMLSHEDWKMMSEVAKTSVVIGITESKDFELAVRCLEADMYRLFVKPISIQALIEAVHETGKKKQGKDGKVKEWISNLIFGQVTHLREVWDQAVQLGYDALPSVVMVAKISRFNEMMKNKSDGWKKQVLSEVYATIKTFCDNAGLISALIQDEFVLLYTPKKGEQKQEILGNVKKLGFQLYNWVKNHSGHSLFIASGNEYKNPMHLYHSYEEAKRLLSLEFYFSSGKVCHYSDFPDLFNKDIITQIDVPFAEAELKKENLSFIYAELVNQLNHLKKSGIFPLYYKLTLIYVLLKMTKHFKYDEKEQFTSFLQNSEIIINSESVDDILPRLKAYLEEITENAVFSTHHIIIDRVLDYINENFHQAVTLEQAAEYINRSPYYLSHLFKKVMNMTFVEYMTQVRIKKAKELLLQDDYTISDISAIIGYQDPNYFSRVFKAICGLSPKQWKTQKNLERAKNPRSADMSRTILQNVTNHHNYV
jgi:two-component system response regulator YesN